MVDRFLFNRRSLGSLPRLGALRPRSASRGGEHVLTLAHLLISRISVKTSAYAVPSAIFAP
ncbi:hypothetical protein ACFPRL_36355 [Pseudoclavibacter helvolus]